MAFASFDSNRSSAPMAEINMVPLIDVMLVLLVIFIVTAPLLTNTVKLDLPKADAAATTTKPDKIEFAIDSIGNLYWNSEPVSRPEASRRFVDASKRQPQPEVHLRADREVPYRYVAETLADASKAGLSKVGFISAHDDR
jgi:biopolymer transport protein ExbD